MKKKILYLGLLLVMLVAVTACGSNSKLNEIAQKINNCESVKKYKQYNYEINA